MEANKMSNIELAVLSTSQGFRLTIDNITNSVRDLDKMLTVGKAGDINKDGYM